MAYENVGWQRLVFDFSVIAKTHPSNLNYVVDKSGQISATCFALSIHQKKENNSYRMVVASRLLRGSAINSPRQLYKYLIRECRKLPQGPQEFYKHSVKQSFKQHADEPDSQRVKEIINKAYEDSKWVLKKYSKDSGQA